MNTLLIIEGAASVVVVAGLAVAGRALWKHLALKRRRARLRAHVHAFLADRPTIAVRRWLGVGNVGAVVLAGLAEGWEREVSLFWRSRLPMPAEVVVKVAQFSGGTTKRREILARLASDLEADLAGPDPVPICPMLALGFVERGLPDGNALVEVMPLVEGHALKVAIAEGRLTDREASLRELLGILRSVLFLEARGLYNRNVDTENVIVRQDGTWVRIDYDSIKAVDELPLERMERLSRLVAAVFGAVARTPADLSLLARVRQQSRTAPESWQIRGLPMSTADLVREIESVLGTR